VPGSARQLRNFDFHCEITRLGGGVCSLLRTRLRRTWPITSSRERGNKQDSIAPHCRTRECCQTPGRASPPPRPLSSLVASAPGAIAIAGTGLAHARKPPTSWLASLLRGAQFEHKVHIPLKLTALGALGLAADSPMLPSSIEPQACNLLSVASRWATKPPAAGRPVRTADREAASFCHAATATQHTLAAT
jgi:hypothetical protein